MVRALDPPARPLRGGTAVRWRYQEPNPGARRPGGSWPWCRVYHRDYQTPTATTSRSFGPLARFDHHTPAPTGEPTQSQPGRTVLYLGGDLETSVCEVFGDTGEVAICPNFRVALLRPVRPLILFSLTVAGSALAVGAIASVGDGPHPRSLTQQWARAIYEDDPTGEHVEGIIYPSAYNFGTAMAIWDSTATTPLVEVVTGARDIQQDFPLAHPTIYARLLRSMTYRRYTVRLVAAEDCRRCVVTQRSRRT